VFALVESSWIARLPLTADPDMLGMQLISQFFTLTYLKVTFVPDKFFSAHQHYKNWI